MSELISEIEAFTAWKNGQDVEIYDESMCWHPLLRDHGLCVFDSNGRVKFRLKPRTVNLNGVEVGQLRTAMWCINCPKEVTLEFKTEDDAHHFYANAMKIFNGV